MLESCHRCSVECWKTLDGASKYVFDMPIIELMTKVHNCVIDALKIVVTWLLFFDKSSVMIPAILIACAIPDKMEALIQKIDSIVVGLINKGETTQTLGLVLGTILAFGFTIIVLSFYIGARKGVELHKLATQ